VENLDIMKKRLAELEAEYKKGTQVVQETQIQMHKIEGAILVLRELIFKQESGKQKEPEKAAV